MRILFVGRYDWANVCNRVARAMNSTGEHSAHVFTERAHPFGYKEDMVAELRTHRDLFDAAADAEWVVSTGDGDYQFFAYLIGMLLPVRENVRLAMRHPGTAYRSKHVELDAADRKLGIERRFIAGDLYRLAKDDPKSVPYFAPPDDVASDLPVLVNHVVVSHSPSSRSTKGTDVILKALDGLNANVDLIEGVTYSECAARRARSHIFVDQMCDDIAGFGAAAVEALAVGCVVIAKAHNAFTEEIGRFYDPPPIVLVRDGYDLRREVDGLISDPILLLNRRRRSLLWAQKWATKDAIASYWMKWLL